MPKRLTTIAIALTIAISTIAAPITGPRPESKVNPQDERTYREYSDSLLEVTATLSAQYVREVNRRDLVQASLESLYQSVRTPFPADIRNKLRASETFQELGDQIFEARRRIGSSSALEDGRDIRMSIDAIASRLDPYCGLVPANEFMASGDANAGFGFDLTGQTTGPTRNFRRGGIALAPTLRPFIEPLALPWRVQQVIPGGPAQAAGLRPEDLITHVNGEAITHVNSSDQLKPLLQPNLTGRETPITRFRVLRSGQTTPLEIGIRPATFTPESVTGIRRISLEEWDFWIDRDAKLAFVRLGSITRSSAEQLGETLESLESDGLRGLILDLRACPGGYLDPAIAVSATFIPEGLIAQSTGRNLIQPTIYRTNNSAVTRFQAGDYPVVVLIGPDTSGGGELIAAAMQDNMRAIIAGERTRGKATIQKGVDVGMGDVVFKLTTGTFLRPNGKNLQRFPESRTTDDWGVQPDRDAAFPLTNDVRSMLRNQWLLQTLRPWDSPEILPLDDPRGDPQQQAALQRLRKALTDPKPKRKPPANPDSLPPLDPVR